MTMIRGRQEFMAPPRVRHQIRLMARGKGKKDPALRSRVAARMRALLAIYLSHESSPAASYGHTSAASVARALGVEPQVLQHYVDGTRYPDEKFMIRFCRLTNGTTDWILRARLDGMPSGLAGLIGALYPALVLEGEPAEAAAGRAKSAPEPAATEKT